MLRNRSLADRVPRQEAAAAIRVGALAIPTLLVRGGMSDVLSGEGAKVFLDVVPLARYAYVGQAAHIVAGDRNDIFVAAVADFLAEVVPV